MLKKLLLLLLIGFAFSEVNAQNIVSIETGCGDNTYEFEPQLTLVNGKYDYVRLSTNTLLGSIYSATTGANTVGIQFDGTQWVFYYNGNPTNVVFYNTYNGPELYPPATGWISDGSPCPVTATLELAGAVGVQERIVSFYAGCIANTLEFSSITSPNGYDAYRVLQTGTNDQISTWGGSQGAVLSPVEILIVYNSFSNIWIIYDATQVYFENTSTSFMTPADGWTPSTACSPGDTVTLISENSGVLPVEEQNFSNITIYPNPSNGFINISNLKETSRVRITNITGQIVKDVMVGVNDNRIDIQELSQGFYFVELEGKKTIKLLKR